MLRAIIFSSILFAGFASAADITLSWTNATKNIDDTDIPTDTADPNALKETIIYWGACLIDDTPAAPLLEKTVPTTVPGQAETTQVIITTPGRWCFVGIHVNNAGQTSDYSNPTFRIIASVPMPPENLTVQDIQVFYVIQRENRFTLLPVGTIPAGTACSTTQYVNGYFAVPRELVTWTSNTKPLVVVAQCGP